jgi:hypothetical protein
MGTMKRPLMGIVVALLLVGCYKTNEPREKAGGTGARNGPPEMDAAVIGDSYGDSYIDAGSNAYLDVDADGDKDRDAAGVAVDECVTDDDCNRFGGNRCCHCHPFYSCLAGRCVDDGIEICYDAPCCFNFGCGPNCEILTPYPDYDGTCGGVDCSVFRALENDFYQSGCCTDGDTLVSDDIDKCGFDISKIDNDFEPGICLQFDRPGELDPSCPDGDLDPRLGTPMKGCCTRSGHCGVMMTGQGLGCAYPEFWPGNRCGHQDGGVDKDAGD